jgi:hypothetical protein
MIFILNQREKLGCRRGSRLKVGKLKMGGTLRGPSGVAVVVFVGLLDTEKP